MTHWSLAGSRPPSTDEEWEEEFAKYQASPEYKLCVETGVYRVVFDGRSLTKVRRQLPARSRPPSLYPFIASPPHFPLLFVLLNIF